MASETIAVVTRIPARADTVAELRTLLSGVIDPTRKEAGCISYELWQNRADLTDFTLVEASASESAHKAHLASEHVQQALARLPELIAADPDIRRYSVIA